MSSDTSKEAQTVDSVESDSTIELADSADLAEQDEKDSPTSETSSKTGKASKKKVASKKTARSKKRSIPNPLASLITFLRQVITELKKVHWITRKQTIGYTIVVLLFVIACVGFVAGLDVGFSKIMGLLFTN